MGNTRVISIDELAGKHRIVGGNGPTVAQLGASVGDLARINAALQDAIAEGLSHQSIADTLADVLGVDVRVVATPSLHQTGIIVGADGGINIAGSYLDPYYGDGNDLASHLALPTLGGFTDPSGDATGTPQDPFSANSSGVFRPLRALDLQAGKNDNDNTTGRNTQGARALGTAGSTDNSARSAPAATSDRGPTLQQLENENSPPPYEPGRDRNLPGGGAYPGTPWGYDPANPDSAGPTGVSVPRKIRPFQVTLGPGARPSQQANPGRGPGRFRLQIRTDDVEPARHTVDSLTLARTSRRQFGPGIDPPQQAAQRFRATVAAILAST